MIAPRLNSETERKKTIKFKLNKLTLLLLAAPLAANASVTWSGTNDGIPETLGKVNPDTVNGLIQVGTGTGNEGNLRIDGGSVVNTYSQPSPV